MLRQSARRRRLPAARHLSRSRPASSSPSSSRSTTRSSGSASSSAASRPCRSPRRSSSSTTARTDGTRDILHARSSRRRPERASTSRRTRARAPPCATASSTPPATSSSCRTPTWNTTRPSTRGCIQPILEDKADVVFGSRFIGEQPPRAVLLALRRQQGADDAVEHVHQPEPDRHGDLLQGLPPRGAPGHHAQVEPLRLRAGGHRQDRQEAQPALAHLRGADQLLRPDLRGRQEDRPEGRRSRRCTASSAIAGWISPTTSSAASSCGPRCPGRCS